MPTPIEFGIPRFHAWVGSKHGADAWRAAQDWAANCLEGAVDVYRRAEARRKRAAAAASKRTAAAVAAADASLRENRCEEGLQLS